MKLHLLTMMAALVAGAFSAQAQEEKAKVETKGIRIVMTTSKGDIEATLTATKTPITVRSRGSGLQIW